MAAKDKAPAKKKKKTSQKWKCYEVKGDQLIRKNKVSPKEGAGCFMANHKNRWTCGKSGYMEKK